MKAWPTLRRWLFGLSLRLMLFNCLLVFMPVAGLLFLDLFESRMLVSQENTLVAQARVLAASLAAGLDSGGKPGLLNDLATASLEHLNGRTLTRLRVLNRDSAVVADSSRLRKAVPTPESPSVDRDYGPSPSPSDRPATDDSASIFYRLGSLPFRAWRAINPPPSAVDDSEEGFSPAANPAVIQALSGRYGSFTRISSGQRSVTLYAAIPIMGADGVAGAVLASQSTYRTLRTIYEIRRSMFQIFLVSLGLSLALSFLLSLTISRPLRRMHEMAEGFIDQWGRPIGHFKPVRGSDELASLSRSLVRLGEGLSDHVQFIQSFASDLAHELRNPLASIRTAAELLEQGCDSEQARLSSIIRAETERIDRLVALSRDLSQLDVAIGRSPRLPVDAGELLGEVWRNWGLRGFKIDLDEGYKHLPSHARLVLADAGFLRQALEKLLENALDFSPEANSVSLSLSLESNQVALNVADRGPGVPPQLRQEIFRRFYSVRREQGHTGLGLSLALAIAEAFGGSIRVADNPSGGAVFSVILPKA